MHAIFRTNFSEDPTFIGIVEDKDLEKVLLQYTNDDIKNYPEYKGQEAKLRSPPDVSGMLVILGERTETGTWYAGVEDYPCMFYSRKVEFLKPK